MARIVAVGDADQCQTERFLALAQEARDRAEEILVKAENFKDAGAKQNMLEIAAKYEELANQMEEAAFDEP